MSGSTEVEKLDALGVIEAFSVASLIEGADAAAKAAEVKLIEIKLAMALGGKAFVTLTGPVGAVRSAVTAGAEVISRSGMLVNTVVIPSPREELLRDIL
jgi:microcompartment protein CcmL/EutN